MIKTFFKTANGLSFEEKNPKIYSYRTTGNVEKLKNETERLRKWLSHAQ
jgi:hypothetical protein